MTPGWLDDLAASVTPQTRLIVELGSWLGLSTRFLLDRAPQATVIAIDHWRGGPDHQSNPEFARLLPRLYETFLVNCWNYRERLIPLRMTTLEGLAEFARYGFKPDLIYVDADHEYEAVWADVEEILRRFPDASVVGDDWDWEGVSRAVREIAAKHGRRVDVYGVAWRM